MYEGENVRSPEKIAPLEKLHDLYSLPYIRKMFKLRRVRGMGHGAYTGEKKNTCVVLIGKPEAEYHFEALGIDGRVILKWTLKK
jgi:hypothetical protein